MNIANETPNGEPINSSTGSLGVDIRQYERLYLNATRFSDNPNEIVRNFRILIAMGNMCSERIGRVVLRGQVSDEALKDVLKSELASDVEVVLPVREFGKDGVLVYLARNEPERTAIVPVEKMTQETETNKYRAVNIEPLERIEAVIEQGYEFTNKIHTEEDSNQVFSLWGPIFGWSVEQVANLARRLESERKLEPQDRSVWLSMIKKGDEVVSLAMAERLSLPASDGSLDIVESTEWCTKKGHNGKGLITAVLSLLNSQILQDMQGNTPLIFAECNFQSRSDWAGHGAGFRVPERILGSHTIPQLCIQNVYVNDGQPIEAGKLRDFTFMYLPSATIEQTYNPEQITNIIETALPDSNSERGIL